MAFTPVEIIALIFALAVIVKILVVSVNGKLWFSIVKPLYSNAVMLVIAELVLSLIVFYYIVQELNIIQISACLLLGALLTGMTLAVYPKDILSWAGKILKNNALKKAWLPLLVWLLIAVLTLIAIFY